MAYECELAGKAGDMAKIGVLTGPLLEYLDKISSYLEIRLDQIRMQENADDSGSNTGSDVGSADDGADGGADGYAQGLVSSARYVNGSADGDNENNCSTTSGNSVRRYSVADVKGLSEDLKKALDEFDSSSAEKIINDLGTISFSQEAADIVIECRDAVDCFDYDGVKAGIDRLCTVLGIT